MKRGPDPEPVEFQGHWVQQGAIKVPVLPKDDYDDIFDFGPSITERPVKNLDHVPTRTNHLLHEQRGETCEECATAARMHAHNLRNEP